MPMQSRLVCPALGFSELRLDTISGSTVSANVRITRLAEDRRWLSSVRGIVDGRSRLEQGRVAAHEKSGGSIAPLHTFNEATSLSGTLWVKVVDFID